MTSYITLVGKRASGKDAFSGYALQRYSIPSIKFSTVITQLGVELGLVTSEDMQDKAKAQYVGNTLRSRYGERFYTERLAKQIQGKTYTINGARHPKEIACFRDILGQGVVLVGLLADIEKRFERAKSIGIVNSYEHFLELESNPAEANIDLLLQQADFQIINNGSLKEYHKQINELLSKLKI